jgi:hypothetical protein
MVSAASNDHGLLNREPAIGRQKQESPLALRRLLLPQSWAIRGAMSSRLFRAQPGRGARL